MPKDRPYRVIRKKFSPIDKYFVEQTNEVEKFRAYVRDFEKFRQERAAKRRQAKLQQEEKAKQSYHDITQLSVVEDPIAVEPTRLTFTDEEDIPLKVTPLRNVIDNRSSDHTSTSKPSTPKPIDSSRSRSTPTKDSNVTIISNRSSIGTRVSSKTQNSVTFLEDQENLEHSSRIPVSTASRRRRSSAGNTPYRASSSTGTGPLKATSDDELPSPPSPPHLYSLPGSQEPSPLLPGSLNAQEPSPPIPITNTTNTTTSTVSVPKGRKRRRITYSKTKKRVKKTVTTDGGKDSVQVPQDASHGESSPSPVTTDTVSQLDNNGVESDTRTVDTTANTRTAKRRRKKLTCPKPKKHHKKADKTIDKSTSQAPTGEPQVSHEPSSDAIMHDAGSSPGENHTPSPPPHESPPRSPVVTSCSDAERDTRTTDTTTSTVAKRRKRSRITCPKSKKRGKTSNLLGTSSDNTAGGDETEEFKIIGGMKYRVVPVKKRDMVTPNVRRSKRTRIPPVQPWSIVEYHLHKGNTPSKTLGREIKHVLVPVTPEPKPRALTKPTADEESKSIRIGDNEVPVVMPGLPKIVPKNLEGDMAGPSDDTLLYKFMTESQFSHGCVVLKKNAEKPSSHAGPHTLVFYVAKGSVMVTINDETMEVKEKRCIHIPPGSTYSLTNTRSTVAELFYTVHKDTEDEK